MDEIVNMALAIDKKGVKVAVSAARLICCVFLFTQFSMHIQAQNADVLRVLELAKKDYAFPVNNADQKLINEAYVAFKFQLPSADSLKQELEKIDHELAPVDSAAYHFAFGVKHYYLYEYDKSLELCSKSYKILEQENQITAGLFVKVIITNLIYASKQEEEAFAMYNEILAHDSCPAFMVGKLNHNIGALLFEVESEALMGDDLEEKKRVFDLIDKHMKASADFHKAKGDFASLSSNLSIWVTSKIQQEQFVEAIALVDSVVSIAESMGDFNRKAFTLIKKAQIQDGIGRPDLAVKTIDWAINHLDSIGDFVQYNHALSKKRASFLLLENYKGADSVAMVMYMNNVNNFDDELSESIANYQVQFETANDQLKIKEQELEISQRNLYLYLSIATLAGAVLVFLLLYQRSKRAAEAEKNKVLAESKKESVKAVIMAQEEERQRIAKDLHDGIVQQLGGLKLGLEKLFIHSSSLESERLLSVLDDSADELRTISHQMMPKALIELGLIPAMNDMLERSLGNTSIAYEFEHFGIVNRWEEAVEVAIYRISQELVNNVIKHSSATEVSVQLLKSGSNAILIIEDNGKGFDRSKKQTGIGLMNIASRVDTVNGHVNFEPSPNSGTLVTIKIPIHA